MGFTFFSGVLNNRPSGQSGTKPGFTEVVSALLSSVGRDSEALISEHLEAVTGDEVGGPVGMDPLDWLAGGCEETSS